MTKFIFRIAFIVLGSWLFYLFGSSFLKTLQYRFTGEVVTGRIIGFSAGRNGTTPQEESTGIRNGKRKARRPFFRYPTSSESKDSLTQRSGVSTFSFSTYAINDPVTVVFSKDKPQDSFIYGFQILLVQGFVICFCIFMIVLGIRMKL